LGGPGGNLKPPRERGFPPPRGGRGKKGGPPPKGGLPPAEVWKKWGPSSALKERGKKKIKKKVHLDPPRVGRKGKRIKKRDLKIPYISFPRVSRRNFENR